MTLGQKIRQLRQRTGYSQRELGRDAGISYSTVRLIEEEQRTNPGIWTLHAIATTLGVSLSEVMAGVERPRTL